MMKVNEQNICYKNHLRVSNQVQVRTKSQMLYLKKL